MPTLGWKHPGGFLAVSAVMALAMYIFLAVDVLVQPHDTHYLKVTAAVALIYAGLFTVALCWCAWFIWRGRVRKALGQSRQERIGKEIPQSESEQHQ